MVAVVDYGLGNLGSIANMIKAIGEKSVITNEKDKIAKADRIILPGVGAYDAGITNLEQRGLVEFLKEQADSGKPIMGICLGMQLLGRGSEEGEKSGLGLIPFDNVRFNIPDSMKLKVPHMGWDIVDFKQKDNKLLAGIGKNQRYVIIKKMFL